MITFRRILLVLVLVQAIVLGALWRSGWLQTRLDDFFRNRLVKGYITRLQPKLPFVIESFETDSAWNLKTTLRWKDWRVRLSGPLKVSAATDEKDEYLASYSPIATLETVDGGAATRSPPLELQLWAQVSPNLTRLTEIGLKAEAHSFDWAMFGVKAEKLHADATWRRPNGSADMKAPLLVTLRSHTLSWTDPKHSDHAVNIEDPLLRANTELNFLPFAAGPLFVGELRVKSGEALWGNRYVELPLAAASPIRIEAHADLLAPVPTLRKADVTFGSARNVQVGYDGNTIRWQAREIALPALMRLLLSQPEAQSISGLEAHAGVVGMSGSTDFNAFVKCWVCRVSATLKIENADLDWRQYALALRGLSATIPIENGSKIAGATLSVADIFYKRFHGKLNATKATFDKGELNIADGIPLSLDGIPLSIGPIRGSFRSPTQFKLSTSARLKSFQAARVTEGLCLKARTPPVELSAEFPDIELTPGLSIDLTGSLRANLFGGFVEVDEMGVFDLSSDVPEVDFSARWDAIRLNELGAWLGFGEMDGTLVGFANEVTFQSWLPTHYDFKSEVKPLNHSDVVFSPMAMKNFVSLFAGDGLSQLPDFVQTVLFGWPSRLFGGYDVYYAGVSAFSNDGMTLIETLDPVDAFGKAREHFILYGPRFKMPLKSPRYPLVVDSTGVSNYMRFLTRMLTSIAAAKQKDTKNDLDEKPCIPAVY